MEPLIAIASILVAIAAWTATAHSYHVMRASRSAELQMRELLLTDPKLRDELLDALSKRRVGDQTIDEFEKRIARLLVRMPKQHQPRVRAALTQRSRRGQRDYMFKLACEDPFASRKATVARAH